MNPHEQREANADERAFRVRMSGTPWAMAMAELVDVAQGVLYDGPLLWVLDDMQAQLETRIRRRQELDPQEVHAIRELCWKAEMEREARVSADEAGPGGGVLAKPGSDIPSARGADPASGPAPCAEEGR